MALTQKMSGRLEAYGRSEMNDPTEKAADCAGSSVSAKTPVLVAAPVHRRRAKLGATALTLSASLSRSPLTWRKGAGRRPESAYQSGAPVDRNGPHRSARLVIGDLDERVSRCRCG
ncbi:hypothetical protein ACWD3K_35485 [Streptomyces sp. NPDC002778]